jgi:hypothetical protein
LINAMQLVASGDNDFGAGFIAFVVVVVMGVACYFLFRSMSKHLRKVPPSFEPPPPSEADKPTMP